VGEEGEVRLLSGAAVDSAALMISASIILLLLAAEPASLTAAKGHLKAGKLDEVLFDLQNQKFEGKDKESAADVLAQTASKSLAANDDLMALQLAQMSLSYAQTQPIANEVAARASRKLEQFADAERYGDGWLKATNSDEARLFRAELAVEGTDWNKAIDLLSEGRFSGPQIARAQKLRDTAKQARAEQLIALSEVRAMELAMSRAAEDAAKLKEAAPAAKSGDVIVYSTTWCGYCKRLKSYLTSKNVRFIEKDVEKDPTAAPELARKMTQANMRPSGGVPWTDVRGTLVGGYDVPKLEAALRK
jgi:glutaredoxin